MIKKFVLGAAAVLAVAAPGAASAATGYLGAVYNSVDDGTDTTDGYGIEGSIYTPSSGFGLELDAAGIMTDDDNAVSGAAHVLWRNESHLFGVFVGGNDTEGFNSWHAGFEGAKYFDRFTLNGALTYGEADGDIDGYGVNLGGSFFAADNLRIDADISYGNLEGPVNDDNATGYGIGAEYQLGSIPISLGAKWNHFEFDDANLDADAIMVNLRYNWGGTLLERDRGGASQAQRVSFNGIF